MTPQEQAKELFYKFYDNKSTDLLETYLKVDLAKMSSLTVVDEILKNCYEVMKPFWQEVKQEIEKL